MNNQIESILDGMRVKIDNLKKSGLGFPKNTEYDWLKNNYDKIKLIKEKEVIDFKDYIEVECIIGALCFSSNIKIEGHIYNLLYLECKSIQKRFTIK